jgi:hypothetical protein
VENALTANGNKIDAVVGFERRHRRRRDPGAGRAKAGRQGAGSGQDADLPPSSA